MALADNVICHIPMDEPEGTRVDVVGSSLFDAVSEKDHATPGPVSSTTLGNGLNAFQASRTAGKYLCHEGGDGSQLNFGDTDWTIAVWVRFDSAPSSGQEMGIAGRDDGSSNRQWRLDWHGTSNRFRFFVFNSSNSVAGTVSATTLGAPSTGTDYLIICRHSATNNDVGIQVNNGAEDTASTSSAGGSGNAGTFLGLFEPTSGNNYHAAAKVGPFTAWDTELDSTEASDLWNSGNGDYSWVPSNGHYYESRGLRLVARWAVGRTYETEGHFVVLSLLRCRRRRTTRPDL